MFLTQQQVRDYKTNGFITEIQVTEEDETKRYRELFDQLEAKEGPENCQIGLVDRHFDQKFIYFSFVLLGVLQRSFALLQM